jgi:hypothetical protein
MFTKTTLAKIAFVVALLGVLALAALAPSAARAFFQNSGLAGFFSRPTETAVAALSIESDSSYALPSQVEAPAGLQNDLSAGAGQDEFELVGTLTAKDGEAWKVDTYTVWVTSATEFKSALEVGAVVKVHGALQADGSILAREIELAPAGSQTGVDDNGNSSVLASTAAQFEFVDTLTAKDGQTWMVGAWTVTVTPATELKGVLEVGALVKVHGTRQADGSILAREIALALPEDTVKAGLVQIVGTLEAKAAASWTVSGITVVLSQTTEVYGSLNVGDRVKVEGTLLADGSIQAREIKLADADDDDDNGNDNEDRDDNSNDDNGNDDNSNDDNGNINDDNSNDDNSDDDDNGNDDNSSDDDNENDSDDGDDDDEGDDD